MATNGGQVIFDVGFNVNSESLKAVREELKSIQSMTTNDIVSSDPYSKIKQGLRDAQDAARDLDNILQDSFNQDLGVMNIAKFQQGVEKSYGSLNALQARLSGAGDVGATAFRRICTEIITTNSYVKKTDELVSKMATTLGNTLKWNISSSVINKLTGSIQEAWGYTKALDGSLNDIQIVTNKSSEDMAKFAIQANNAAKALKTTTTAYTDAALTFYQQGLSDKDVAARAETSLKVSNVTGLSGDQSAEYVTAVLNGYKVAAEDAEEAMDKLAAVGAATASSLAELSEGMAKVASAANAMGVSEDQLAATLSTVISVTRQDASTVGTAFKTIYARISDIKAGTAEAEISLGNYTKKMAEMGFSVLDSTGNMRDLGEVIEEIGGKWATLSREQQISLAQTMAGTRQYNNLIALFDNWADYEDALNVSMQANGTLQKQQEIYAESLTAKLNGLKAAKEDLFDSLVDTDSFKDLIEIFTKLINILSTFVDGIGGGGAALAYLGSILTKVFNKQIAGSIQNLVTNLNGMKQNAENAAAKMQLLKEMTQNKDPYVANFAKAYEEQLPLMNSVSEKTREIMTATLEAKAAIDAEAESYDNAQQEIEDYFKAKTGENYQGINEKGEFNQKQNNQLNVLLDKENESFSSTGKEISDLEELYQKYKELQDLQEKAKNDSNFASSHLEELMEAEEEIKKLQSELDNINVSQLQDKLDNINWDILPDDIKQQAQSLISQINSAAEENGALNIEDLMGLTDSDTKENIISILSGIFEQAGVKFEEKIKEMKQQASEDGQQQGANIKANQIQAGKNQKDVLDVANLEVQIKKYTDLASSIMGVVGAVQTLQNLGNIWNNDDISIGEKITQTAMALSGVFVALIPTLQTLIGLEKVKAVWDVILAKTGNSVLLASLAIVASFTAIIAVGAGLVLLFKDIQATSPEGQLKKAQAAADATAESLDKATQKVQDLKDAFDNYDKIVDKLNSCTIGTQEWKEALQEANDQILALLEKYPELQEFVSRDASGMLSISEEGQKQALKNASIEQNKARIANMGANAKVAQAQEKVVKKDLDNASYNWDESLISDNIDALRDLSFEEFSKKLEEIGYNYDQTEGDLKKLQSSINNLGKATDVTASKMEILGQEMAAQETTGKYGDNNAAITEMTGELNEETYNNIYKNVIEQTKKGINANSFDRDKEVVDLMSRYNAATGKNLSVKAVKGTDNNRSFDVRDENGDIKNITAEQMAAEIAAAEALQEVSKNAELASNALANMKANIKNSGLEQGLQNYITSGNLESMTQEEYDSLVSDIGDKDIASYLQEIYGLSDSEMQDIFGEDYAEDFQNALDNYGTAFDTFKEGVLLKSQNAFDNLEIDTDKFSVNTKKNILNALNNAAINGGKEGLQEVENLFNNMSTENVEAFANSITNIDWKSENIADLRKTLEEAGVTTDFTDEQLKSFIHTMRGVGEAADFSTLAEQYKNLHDIIDGLQQGDTISQEDYDKLGAAGQSYFRLMLDGSYKLIGDAEEFYNTVNQQSIQGFQDNIEVLKEKNAALQNITTNAGNWEDFQSVQGWGDEQKGVAQLQLDYLSTTGYDPEQIAKWQEELDIGQVTSYTDANGELVNSFNDISQAVTTTGLDINALNDIIKQNEEDILQQEIAIGMSAKNFKELRQMYEDGTISLEAFNEASREMDAIADLEGLDAEELSNYTDYLQEAAENSEELADSLADDDKAAKIVAKSVMKMNKGIESLSKGFKEWKSILSKSDKASQEFADAMSDTKDAMGDLLDINKDFISDDFVTEHLNEIAKAAEGDEEAIDNLKSALADDIMAKILVDNAGFINNIAETQSLYENLKNSMPDLEVGATLESGSFIDGLNELISSTGMTVEQVNALCDSLGFEAAYTTETVQTSKKIPTTTTYHTVTNYKPGSDGFPATWTETEQSFTTYEEATGEIPITAMDVAPAGQVATPKISGLTKKAGGSMNNNSSSNKGGGKKGGGGGGGGAKADQKGYKDAKPNRYHDVEVSLKDINNEMERLNKNREFLTGADLAASYQKELELLDKQINALTEKQRLQKEEAKELRSKGHTVQKDGEVKQIKSLAEQGVTFDEQGNISNYNEAIINRTNEINQIIDNYNKLSADQQTDELKKQIEDAEFAYDQFMEDISRYETLTQDEMVETANAIADALNKKIELKIEKFSMTIDLKLETREAENDLEDFQSKMEKREKTAAGRTQTAANKFMNYMDKDTGVQAEIDRVNKIKEDIQNMQNGGHSDVYSEYDEESGTWVDNIAAAQEDLKKYTEQMMSDMESIEDLMDEINQGLLDTFDEIQEGFDDQIAGYEAVSDHIEHNISLIEQLYGDESSDKLGEWYDAQYKNSLGKVDMLKKEADFWQKQMENAENDDAYKKAKENWMNSINELNAAVEDTLDTIIASYENSIDQIFDKLNSSLTDGLSLDYVGEEWELMNQNADRYLDTINSTYEVQKLQRKYQQSINDTDSLSAQKKLNDLMQQEISYLEEKDKLTQYDIDRANLKYEIALKQIALEEAQQNKSTLRLKRDSQGNYSYQYAGDEEGVADKQQELADAQNQLYNLDKDAYQQNLDDMYNIYSEFQSKMTEVAMIYGRESEEYEQYRVLYEKQYGDMINGIITENEYIKTNLMQSSYDALALMYETDSESFANMTRLNIESFSEMTADIVQQQLPAIVDGNSSAIETMIQQMSGEGGFQAVMQNVWSEIQKAAETYQKRIQEISSQSGTDLHDLQVNTDDVLKTLQGWVEENDKIIGDAEASKAAYDTIAAGVKNLADQYDKAKQEAINTAKESTELQKQLNEETWKELEAQKALDNLVASLKEWNNIKPEIKTFKTVTINESSGGGSGSGGGGGGGGSSSPSSGTTPSTNSKAKQFYIYGFSTQCSKSKTKLAGPYSSRPDISKRASWQKAEIRSFKSGGYTGRWLNGSQEANGRLALLHQKELVLNEDDTSNLLDTIKELRHGLNFDNLTEAMSSQMRTVQQSSLRTQNQIVDQLSHIISTIDNLSNAIVEQQVSINARFEDARSSQDIMNAIDQLTNRASQMAFNVNRKR